jgi:hypothetical protein
MHTYHTVLYVLRYAMNMYLVVPSIRRMFDILLALSSTRKHIIRMNLETTSKVVFTYWTNCNLSH